MSKPKVSEHLVNRDGVFCFRRRIPTDLLNAFNGKREVRISLNVGKTDRREAEQRARRLSVEWDQRFERARREQSHKSWSAEDLQTLCDAWVRWRLHEDDAVRRVGCTDERLDEVTDTARTDLERTRRALALGNTRNIESQLEDSAHACEVELPRKPELVRELALNLLRAEVAALESTLARDRGEIIDSSPAPAVVPPPKSFQSRRTRARSGVRLDDLIDYWAMTGGKRETSIAEARKAAKDFAEVNGAPTLHQITRQHFVAFRDWAVAQGRSPATVKKALALLRAAFTAAIEDDQFEFEANPADRVKVRGLGEVRKPRDAFTVEQLQQLVDTPVFTQGERPRGGKGEAALFVPLITPFTGRRQAEIL